MSRPSQSNYLSSSAMRFQFIAHAVVLMTAGLASGMIVPANLPDGLWTSEQLDNGTTITTSLDNPTLPPIVESHEILAPSLEKREVGCWGYFLDPGSVNAANNALQAEAGGGIQECSSGGANHWTGEVANGVLVYFCVDQHNECAVLIASTVAQGMGLMDAQCQPYEAGYAVYPDPFGFRFILGKCAAGSNICV